MYTKAISRLKVNRPKWIFSNLMETTRISMENLTGGQEEMKMRNDNREIKLEGEMTAIKSKEQSVSNFSASSKLQRDVFGATILPSNLSFDNMKKLSMNQIKLEEIPLIDEGEPAKEFINKRNEPEVESSEKTEVKKEDEKPQLNVLKMDSYQDIPGPRFCESFTSTVTCTTRHMTVYFLLRLLQNDLLSLFRKYGPIVRLPEIMGGKILLVNLLEHITSIHEQDKIHPASSSLDILECSRLRRHGKQRKYPDIRETEWEKTREIINKMLARDEEKYFEGLEETGSHLLRRIRAVTGRGNDVNYDFKDEINKWSLECLFQILFDKSPDFLDPDATKWPSKNAKLLVALREATRNLNTCENGFQLWRLMSTSASMALDNSCQIVEDFLANYVHQSQINLENKNEGDSFTVTEIMLQNGFKKIDVITNVLDTLLIGMNTLTNTLSFLLYYLAKYPTVQEELFRELGEILPEKYTRLESDHLNSMKYMNACLKETLRLKVPIPIITRYLNRSVIISNFHIPRGTFVIMHGQAESLKEENFEKSREFRPKRWFGAESKSPFLTIPFSAYSKNSFDTRLAEVSVLLSIAQIIRNFKVEFHYGHLTTTSSPLSCLSKPLKFTFLERRG